MDLFGHNKEFQFSIWTCSILGSHAPSVPEDNAEKHSHSGRRQRGGCSHSAHWRGLGGPNGGASHWLCCEGLSLAELLSGQGKTFLPLG